MCLVVMAMCMMFSSHVSCIVLLSELDELDELDELHVEGFLG